jgi:hypothetical protein
MIWSVIFVVGNILYYSFFFLFYIIKWLYLEFLPFFVIYIGIPLFIIGVLLSLSFTAGMVLLIGGLAIGIYYFVTRGILDPSPLYTGFKNSQSLSSENKIFKANFKV